MTCVIPQSATAWCGSRVRRKPKERPVRNSHQSWFGGSLLALGLFWGATALAQAPAAPTSVARPATEITLNLGEQHILPAQGVRSYSEGARGIIDVRLTGDSSRFVLVGLMQGSTTLLLLM